MLKGRAASARVVREKSLRLVPPIFLCYKSVRWRFELSALLADTRLVLRWVAGAQPICCLLCSAHVHSPAPLCVCRLAARARRAPNVCGRAQARSGVAAAAWPPPAQPPPPPCGYAPSRGAAPPRPARARCAPAAPHTAPPDTNLTTGWCGTRTSAATPRHRWVRNTVQCCCIRVEGSPRPSHPRTPLPPQI